MDSFYGPTQPTEPRPVIEDEVVVIVPWPSAPSASPPPPSPPPPPPSCIDRFLNLRKECGTALIPGLPTVVTVYNGNSSGNSSSTDDNMLRDILNSNEVRQCCASLKAINDAKCFCERRLVRVFGQYHDVANYIPYFDQLSDAVRNALPFACGFFVRGGEDCAELEPDHGWDGAWSNVHNNGTMHPDDDEEEDELELVLDASQNITLPVVINDDDMDIPLVEKFDGADAHSYMNFTHHDVFMDSYNNEFFSYDPVHHLLCAKYNGTGHGGDDETAVSIVNKGRKSILSSRIRVDDDFPITHMKVSVNMTASKAPLTIKLVGGRGDDATSVTLWTSRRLMRPLVLRNTSFADVDGHTDHFYDITDSRKVENTPGTVFVLPRAFKMLSRVLRKFSVSNKTIQSRQHLGKFHHGDGDFDDLVAGHGGSRGTWRLVIESVEGKKQWKKKQKMMTERSRKHGGRPINLDVSNLASDVLHDWDLELCHSF